MIDNVHSTMTRPSRLPLSQVSFKVHNVEIAHVTLGALTHHKTKTSHGRLVYKI